MSEKEKLLLETKKEIRSILLSTKTGVELMRLNKEYEMFTGAKINYRGMGYSSLRAFVDDIPDVARQCDDGYGTITLLGVADETTRHIASLVSRQRGKKKSMRGRHYPGPRLGILSNLPYPRASYASRSFGDSHSYPYGSRYSRTITRANPTSSPVSGKLRSSVSDQKSAVFARQATRPLSGKEAGLEVVIPALMTMDPGMNGVAPVIKTMDQGMKTAPGIQTMDQGMKTAPGVKTMDQGMKAAHGLKTMVPESQRAVFEAKTFIPNLKEKLTVLVKRLTGSVIYSSFKKSFEKEFGLKLDVTELGYSSVSQMFSSLGISVRVKPFCSDDYNIMPGPVPSASGMEKGETRQRILDTNSIPAFSAERRPASTAPSIALHSASSTHLPASYPAPPQNSSLVHCLEGGAPPALCPSVMNRPSSRRMSLVSRSSRTAASVSDKPKLPSTPSISQQLRGAISQVLKNSPDGILMGNLEAKLKEMTGVEIDIESTGARSLEHLLVNVPEIVLMQYRGHGQLLLFDPGQAAVEDNTDQRQSFQRKDPVAPDVDCSGRRPELLAMSRLHASRPKPRDIPEDSVGPDQGIASPQLVVGANEYLPIYVSSVVTPGHFWFQIDGEQYGRLVELMETLQSTYNHPKGSQYEMPPFLMKIGQLCAAKFTEDSHWHRGTITGFKDALVQIYYLDYGTTSFVTRDLIRILRSRYLTLPAQAIRARLANVQPVKGEWSEAAYTFFMKHFTHKRLMALITNTTRDGLVSVCLTDTNGEDDIHLNDCLVLEGYAVMHPDEYESEVQASKKAEPSATFSASKAVEVKPSKTGAEDETIEIKEQDIKFVQLPPNYSCHMVRIWDKLYIISNEISTFLWEENVLRTMVRQKGYGYLPKLVLRIDDHLAVMEELAKFNIPGVFVNGEFAELLVLYELSIVIQILEIFEHKSQELKSELKKHLDIFSANPSKWTISTVPSVGDDDCVTVASDDLAVRAGTSRCNIDASHREDAKEGRDLQKEWRAIADQRKKLLHQMPNSSSPKMNAFAVEELSRMEGQMKALEDRYDTIQKRRGVSDVNNNAKINSCLVTTSMVDAKKIQGLAITQSPSMQKKPRTNAVAPMTQVEPTQSTSDSHRNPFVPVGRPLTGGHRAASLAGGVRRPTVGFAPGVRPGSEYGQQMDHLAHMLSQMTVRGQAPLTSPAGLLSVAAGMGYQLPNPQLHNPFGFSAAHMLMQQQQSYFAALQGLSSLVSSGSAYPQTPYDSSLLGISNLSYLAHAAPSFAGSAMPRTGQQGPQQN